jgi:hypothetical protein
MQDITQLPQPELNGHSTDAEKAIALIEQAVTEAEHHKDDIQIWRYNVGKKTIGKIVLYAAIAIGLYFTLHTSIAFINTYVGELYGGLGALPVAILSDASVFLWLYIALNFADNLYQLLVSLAMLCIAVVAVGTVAIGEAAHVWIASYTSFFIMLYTISIYGSALAASVILMLKPDMIARLKHIFVYGYAPDMHMDEYRKISANTPQLPAEASATHRKAEIVKGMLKAGQLDETIIKMRTENKAVQAIASEIGVPENKRDLERRITELKKQKRLS